MKFILFYLGHEIYKCLKGKGNVQTKQAKGQCFLILVVIRAPICLAKGRYKMCLCKAKGKYQPA